MILHEERNGLELKFYELSKDVVSKLGLSLYDLEFVKKCNTLRVYIINNQSNTALIEECVAVDKAFGPFIEESAWIPESLILEVSSPGLFRKLKTKDHFVRAKGSMVELVLEKDLKEITKDKAEGVKGKKIRALLKGVDDKTIDIEFGDKKICIEVEFIKKANLSPDINF